jgi:hypothetical protein
VSTLKGEMLGTTTANSELADRLQGTLLGMLMLTVAGGTSIGDIAPASVVVGFVVGLISILASMVATRNQRVAARIDLWAALISPLFVVGFSWEFGGDVRAIAVSLGALIVPGLFWLLAARRKWPPVLPRSPF